MITVVNVATRQLMVIETFQAVLNWGVSTAFLPNESNFFQFFMKSLRVAILSVISVTANFCSSFISHGGDFARFC
jgi:hypothetical protein